MTRGEMTDLGLLNEAASLLRNGYELTDVQRLMLADILEGEADLRTSFEPFVDSINIAIHQSGGGEAELRLLRHEDTGEIQLMGDNSTNSVRLARDILNKKKDN